MLAALFGKSDPSLIDRVVLRHKRELLAGEAKATRELVQAWKKAEREIEARLELLTRRLEKATATGGRISPNWAFQQARLNEYLIELRGQIDRYSSSAMKILAGQQSKNLSLALAHAEESMIQYGLGSFVRLPREQFERLVGLTADGSPVAEVFGRMGPSTASDAIDILRTGVAAGDHPRKIAARLRKSTGDTRDHSLLVARTEALRPYRVAQLDSFRANDDVLGGWTTLSARDRRTCPICLAMDGVRHGMNETFGGWHPACRCAIIPLLRYGAPTRKTGEDWLREQPEAVVIEKLGPTRGRLFVDGRVGLRDMVRESNDPIWGRQARLIRISDLAPRPDSAVQRRTVADAAEQGIKSAKLRAAVSEASRAVSSLVETPQLEAKRITFRVTKMKGVNGFFDPRKTEIGIHSKGSTPLLTTAHELGHAIDMAEIGEKRSPFLIPGRSYKTREQEAAVNEFFDEVYRTPEVDQIGRLWNVARSIGDHDMANHAKYLLEPWELWARAFAQWVAVETKSAKMLAELEAVMAEARASRFLFRQWENESFDRIRPRIEGVLRSFGKLKK